MEEGFALRVPCSSSSSPLSSSGSGRAWTLRDVRVPAAVLRRRGDDDGDDGDGASAGGAEAEWEEDGDGLVRVDLGVSGDGRLARIDAFPGDAGARRGAECVDGGGRIVMPTFVDMHTHVDKSHTCERSRNEDGSLSGADKSTCEDAAHWTVADVVRRIRFCLECAYVHGTSAVRTHLISVRREQRLIAGEAFRLMREEWRGRVELQGVALTLLADWKKEGYGEEVAVRGIDAPRAGVPAPARAWCNTPLTRLPASDPAARRTSSGRAAGCSGAPCAAGRTAGSPSIP